MIRFFYKNQVKQPMSVFDKNVSPNKLALINAIILTAIIAFLTIFYQERGVKVVIILALTFFSSFFLIKKSIEIFIYRKFKIIYKFIYDTKATKKEEFFYNNILPQKSIDEVSSDVLKWGHAKRDEIAILRQNEAYRREFLMNLSHELKTPIFTTQGYIETLLAGALHDPDVNEKFLRNATLGINRLVQLTNDLDEISKLEAGNMTLSPSEFKIKDLVNDVFNELHLQANAKDMQLVFKEDAVPNTDVIADKDKLKQVVVNLVMNAIKYGNQGGTITVGIYDVDDEKVLIEISDDGPGIAEEHLNRIFERFYRIDRARSRDVGGTGLGLAIVKHIIEAHNQTITVRSKENIGSSFGFTIQKAD